MSTTVTSTTGNLTLLDLIRVFRGCEWNEAAEVYDILVHEVLMLEAKAKSTNPSSTPKWCVMPTALTTNMTRAMQARIPHASIDHLHTAYRAALDAAPSTIHFFTKEI